MPDEIQRGDLVHYKLPPVDQRSRHDVYLSEERYLLVEIDHANGGCLLLSENGRLRWHECCQLEKVNESYKQ
jgi:hypothetical protein